MYCNNCGKQNPEESKFCKHCGSKIIKVSAQGLTTESTSNERTLKESEDKTQSTEKETAGLGGWLALVGIGLVIGILTQAYGLIGFLPLLSENFDIPGYSSLIWMEFVVTIIVILSQVYLLFIYLKKNKNFPKFYSLFLTCFMGYILLDHFLLFSLTAPTKELQQVIDDTLAENSTEVVRTIAYSIIWILYMNTSKRVKATFIND